MSILIILERMNELEVANRVGHSRPSFTKDIYAHLFEHQKEAPAPSFSKYIKGAEIPLN